MPKTRLIRVAGAKWEGEGGCCRGEDRQPERIRKGNNGKGT